MGGRNAYGTRRRNAKGAGERERRRIKNRKVVNTRKKFDEENVVKNTQNKTS